MLPQKPAHISQELWELELPSILGMAHPSISIEETDSEDATPLHATDLTPPAPAPAPAPALASASAHEMSRVEASSPSFVTCNPASSIPEQVVDTSGPIFAIESDTDIDDSGASNELATQVYEAPDIPSDPSELATQVYGPPAVPGGDWSEIWNMDRPARGFITYALSMDDVQLPSAPESTAPVMEWLAHLVCTRRSCTTDDLRHLCQQLPQRTSAKRRRLTTSDGATGRLQRSFSVGAYSVGGCQGIQCNTSNFPWTSCWLTSLVRAAAPQHKFSTCTLLHNVMHYKHADSRNAPNTQNVIVPCDFWRGGQLWIANPSGSIHLDSTSGPGILQAITWPCVVLEPTTPHATYPWSHGDRTILVAHHARGLEALTKAQQDTLAGFGFQLLRCSDAESSTRL